MSDLSLEQRLDVLESRIAIKDELWKVFNDTNSALRDQLNQRLDLLESRIAIKDELLKVVSDTNSALQDQLKARFTFVQAIAAFILIMFAVNFAYEIFRVNELMQWRREAKAALEIVMRNERSQEVINLKSAVVLGTIARALPLIGDARRENERANYAEAAEIAAST